MWDPVSCFFGKGGDSENLPYMGAAIIFVRVWTSSAQLCLPAEAVSYLCRAHPAQLPPQQCNIPILDQSKPCKNLPRKHSQTPLLEPQAVQAPLGLKTSWGWVVPTSAQLKLARKMKTPKKWGPPTNWEQPKKFRPLQNGRPHTKQQLYILKSHRLTDTAVTLITNFSDL